MLYPGQHCFVEGDVTVYTLLGSCVAITLWIPQRKIGAMCHYLLARRAVHRDLNRYPFGYFASDSLNYFVEQLTRRKLQPTDCVVKMFGGGNMFPAQRYSSERMNVATTNIAQGQELLSRFGFEVKVVDVGGQRYRKLFFEVATGDVWVKYGRHNHASSEAVI